MPNKTLAVTPGSGATINTLPDVGAQTKANSLPVVLASDSDALPISSAQLPATLGQKTASASLPVVLSSDGPLANAYGTQADTATPDITASGASFSFVSLYKGMVANGFALLARLPASLGPKAKAQALAVTTATDDPILAAVAATGPGTDHFAVTPTDTAATVFATNARSLYVGTTGDVAVVSPTGSAAVVYKSVPAGAILPIAAKRVAATGTTASNIVGLI